MASISRPVPVNSNIDSRAPSEYALDAVADDLVELMRTRTEDNFISVICADQIEHFRSLNKAGAQRQQEDDQDQQQKRRHSTSTTPITSPPRTVVASESPISPCSDSASTQLGSAGNTDGTSGGAITRRSTQFDPRLNLLFYLHQKTQSLSMVLELAKTCHAMDDTALAHNEHEILNLLSRVSVQGATLEDRYFLDHLYSDKRMLWDKLMVWRLLENQHYPAHLDIFGGHHHQRRRRQRQRRPQQGPDGAALLE